MLQLELDVVLVTQDDPFQYCPEAQVVDVVVEDTQAVPFHLMRGEANTIGLNLVPAGLAVFVT